MFSYSAAIEADAMRQGKQIGLEQGVQIGKEQGEMQMLLSLLYDGSITIEKAAEKAGLTQGEIKLRLREFEAQERSKKS